MAATNGKVDVTKAIDCYRARKGRFDVVDVPDLRFLMVDGHGDPNTSAAFADALGALYPVAYTVKFASKRDLGRDYVVPPLEGLWWAEDMAAFTTGRDKTLWSWTMLIMVPEWVDDVMVEAAIAAVAAKKRPARIDDVRCEVLSEGTCVQTLHVGSFDDEAPVLATMHHDVIPSRGLRMAGTHHEIYFSDPRRTPAGKRRTILRQPVAPVAE
ncbi:GyrI-like domain-containing protein [Prauserella alba]|uniref:GyrI-like domain-containing protein n=1 Tax=Prauserella alba TaxID=176898 RepID=A0ABP4GAA9_9PSEU|nr:GyrI-like domain-containing protein [Prauserella alba]MCP2182804.1 hypothetical protein [Prauserella alba]